MVNRHGISAWMFTHLSRFGDSYTPAGVTETSAGQHVPVGDLIPNFTQVLLHLHSLYLRKHFFCWNWGKTEVFLYTFSAVKSSFKESWALRYHTSTASSMITHCRLISGASWISSQQKTEGNFHICFSNISTHFQKLYSHPTQQIPPSLHGTRLIPGVAGCIRTSSCGVTWKHLFCGSYSRATDSWWAGAARAVLGWRRAHWPHGWGA